MEPLCSMQSCSDENQEINGVKQGTKGTKREGIAGTSGGVWVRTKGDNMVFHWHYFILVWSCSHDK